MFRKMCRVPLTRKILCWLGVVCVAQCCSFMYIYHYYLGRPAVSAAPGGGISNLGSDKSMSFLRTVTSAPWDILFDEH